MYLNNKRKLIILVLIFQLTFAGMCESEGKKTIAIATDDFAEAQVSVANLLANAKSTNLISQEDINEIKPFLQEANDLNSDSIAYGRTLLKNPNDVVTKDKLVEALNKISAVLVRANNAGLSRIKDPTTRSSLSALIVVMQNAATSIINLVESRK